MALLGLIISFGIVKDAELVGRTGAVVGHSVWWDVG
jgi:hypothetical protein